jgi:hypothetical protein
LIALLLFVAGCGQAPDPKERAESVRVSREVRDYAKRILSEAETKKKEEDRCWEHPEEAYRLACQYIVENYPSVVDAQFPVSADQVEKQIDRHLLIRSHYMGKDEEGNPVRGTWEVTAYLDGKWRILCGDLISTRPLGAPAKVLDRKQ